jgi:hypothetical protein
LNILKMKLVYILIKFSASSEPTATPHREAAATAQILVEKWGRRHCTASTK